MQGSTGEVFDLRSRAIDLGKKLKGEYSGQNSAAKKIHFAHSRVKTGLDANLVRMVCQYEATLKDLESHIKDINNWMLHQASQNMDRSEKTGSLSL